MVSESDSLSDAHRALREGHLGEAERICRRALRREPTNAAALCLLGTIHCDRGDDAEAVRLLRNALFIKPDFVGAFAPLAKAYSALSRLDEAADVCRQWLTAEPTNSCVRHLIAALTGERVPARCSDQYVKGLFNQLASTFDVSLVGELRYRGPEVLCEELQRAVRASEDSIDVLDAGCGTGLCGPLLRPICRNLVGVDLAEKMVESARTRGCYDSLVVGELCAFMEARPWTFDAIVSADVLVYFGSLERPMRCAHRALKTGGWLVMCVEALSGTSSQPYRLQITGRYAHREDYIRSVLESAGLEVARIVEDDLRWDSGERIRFFVVSGRKSGP